MDITGAVHAPHQSGRVHCEPVVQAVRSSTNWLWFAPSTFHDAADGAVVAAS